MWEQLMTDVSQEAVHGSSSQSLRSSPMVSRKGSEAAASSASDREVGQPQPSVPASAETDTWSSITATVRERKASKELELCSSPPVVTRDARDNNIVREQQHTPKGRHHHHTSLPLIARAASEDTWSSITESIRQRKSLRENQSLSLNKAAVTSG